MINTFILLPPERFPMFHRARAEAAEHLLANPNSVKRNDLSRLDHAAAILYLEGREQNSAPMQDEDHDAALACLCFAYAGLPEKTDGYSEKSKIKMEQFRNYTEQAMDNHLLGVLPADLADIFAAAMLAATLDETRKLRSLNTDDTRKTEIAAKFNMVKDRTQQIVLPHASAPIADQLGRSLRKLELECIPYMRKP